MIKWVNLLFFERVTIVNNKINNFILNHAENKLISTSQESKPVCTKYVGEVFGK